MKFLLSRIAARIGQWLRERGAGVNHRGVIKDIVTEVELSAGYLFVLTAANLIALCGLIEGSSPVIIGAMLISPLMGPFLSFGFAFVTGDNAIWNRAVRKIFLSVVLTILVAAFATYLSPLKELTGEILSRTRPNLYDLVIAFLAGLAGASALCTKKNYLTVVPGVAIATAVIPPLSVAGFGLGTGNLRVFYGGFLLFFTNFVAIVLSTCIIFYSYGFRRSMATEVELSQIKKRLAFLVAVLLLICVPLIYTLHRSISDVRLHNAIRDALHAELEKAGRSHLATFTYAVGDDGSLEIDAVVNAVHYLSEADERVVEQTLASSLGRKVALNLEQIRVQAGGLRELPPPPSHAIAPPKPVTEAPPPLVDRLAVAMKQARKRLARVIVPARIVDFSVGLRNYSSAGLAIRMKLQRDAPLTGDEESWLGRLLAADLGREVGLTVETVPFVPLLPFQNGETALSDGMKRELLTLREVYRSAPGLSIRVEAFPGHAGRRERRLAAVRLKEAAGFLAASCGVPATRVITAIGAPRREGAAIKVTVETGAMPKGGEGQ